MNSAKGPSYSLHPEFCLFAFLSLFLLTVPWFYGLTTLRHQLLAELAVFGLALLAILFSIPNTVPGFWKNLLSRETRGGLDFWVFAGLIFCFAYVLISVYPYQSVLTWLRLFACVLFYFLIRGIVKNEKSFQYFLWVFVFAGAFYAGYGLLQYHGVLSKSFWFIPEHLASRYVNGGHFAVFLIIPLFAGIALLMNGRNAITRSLLTGLLLMMGWALLLSRSRTVWIAVTAGCFSLILLLMKARFMSKRLWLGLGIAAFFGFAVFLISGGMETIAHRFGELSNFRFYTLQYRSDLWQGCWQAIKQRPWGWGIGTFSVIFPQFRVQSDRFFVLYAHNDFFQTGVDMGWAGILFLGLFIIYYFKNAFSFLKSANPSRSQKIYGMCFIITAIALFLSSQSDFALRIFATSFFFTAFLALSAYLFDLPAPHPRYRTSKLGDAAFRTVSFLLVLLAGILSTRQLFAERHLEKALDLENRFMWKTALTEYEQAARLAPFYAKYRAYLGDLYQRKSGVALKSDLKREFRQKAIQSYQAAIGIFPYWPDYHYSLALLYEEDQQIDSAAKEFKKAITLEPANGFFVSEYAFFALNHLMTGESLEAFEKLKSIPFYEGSTYARLGLCETLRQIYQVTPLYDHLKRVIPDTWQGHYCLGTVLAENGQWEYADTEFDLTLQEAGTALNENNYHFNVRLPITGIYLTHKKFEDALTIYRKALENNSQDLEAQKMFREISRQINPTPIGAVPS